MKICAAQVMIAVMICGISAAHDNYAQLLERKVTLELHEVSLVTGLKEIEKVAGIKIYYSIEQIGVDLPISLEATEQPLRSVLDELLSPLNIKYRVDEKKVAIFLKRIGDSKQDSTDAPGSSANRRDKNIEQTVTGIVTEAATQQPMAGVNVIVKGSTVGTTTDADGKYSVLTENNSTLVFSFIGYKAIEVEVASRTIIDITMEEDVSSLNEVVVYSTGYSEESPERTTGSFSSIGKELLERNVGPDLVSRLNGVTPSLLIDQRGNQTFFSIRGSSTILANDQPLIVVDNFPYNGDINTINPNDIESITVLRDAAAASIWGVRAGNGVIVITTKKGNKDKGIQVGINANITMGDKPDLFYDKRISTSDFIDVERMLFNEGYFDGEIDSYTMPSISPVIEILLKERNGEITESESNALLDERRSLDVRNDLSKYFYQKSVNQQYAINLGGSSEKNSFYFSVGYDKNVSNLVGNKYGRVSLNFQNTFRPIDKLEIESRLTYTQSNNEINNTASRIKMGGRNIYPYAKFTDSEGNPIPIVYDYRSSFVVNAEDQGFLNWQFNPIEELNFNDNTSQQANIRAAAGIKYHFVDGLNAELKYQYETQAIRISTLHPVESYYTRNLINQFSEFDGSTVTGYNIPMGGILTFTNNDLKSHNGRFQLNYNKTWNTHAIVALAGIEAREVTTEGVSNNQYGYDPNLGSSSPVNYLESFVTYPSYAYQPIPNANGLDGTLDRYRSYFANVAYTFNTRYTASVSGRIDQSNLFGVQTNQKSSPLWSVGGKWNINGEHFYTIDWLPALSLRATYGYNGNVDQNVTAYTTARFTTASFSQRNAAVLVNPPNPDLRWEKSGMLNIGIDFSTKRNIITGSIEYYQKKGSDLIGEGPLDPTKGFTSFKGNIASMKGHGWDVLINSVNIDKVLKWSTNFMLSYTTDEVTEYSLTPTSVWDYIQDGSITRFSGDYVPVKGKPLFSMYSFPSAGLDPATGDPRGYLNGEPSDDYAAIQGRATVDSLIYHGRALAPIFGALRNTFSYKGWSLSLNIVYRLGYYFRRNSISYTNLYSSYRGHQDFENRWQMPGDEVQTQVPSLTFPANPLRDAFYLSSESLIEKGDNIRLQDIRFAYDFNAPKIGKLTFSQFQVYAYINNVGLLWTANKQGIDPDFPSMPIPRTYAIGLRIGL